MRDLKSESGYGSIGYIQLDVENSNGNGHGVSSSHPSSHYIPGLADHLEPEFHSVSRRSNRLIAVFNLLSTIVGGGTLSLPYAFSKCGYLGGTSLVLMSVFISIGSLQTLCILARKLGTAKYAEVMEKCIGPLYGDVSNLLLVFMLIFVVIAFMILEKDIAGDIMDYFLVVMIARNLYALRNVSFLGTASVALLLVVILLKSAIGNYRSPDSFSQQGRTGPKEIGDVLYALPIILIAFLCQFNVLGVYSNLYLPTPERMNHVLYYSIAGSGLIYILFGVAGYLFAYDNTLDNILNNFSSHDPSLIIARIGLLLTIICQIPMVVVPCRDSIILLIQKYQGDNNHMNQADHRYPAIATLQDSNSENAPLTIVTAHKQSIWRISNYTYASEIVTFIMAVFCLVLSECVPGVATIWSLAGSSISLILAFYLPAKAYLSFSHHINPSPSWKGDFYFGFSQIMIYVSIVMIALCTYQAIAKL